MAKQEVIAYLVERLNKYYAELAEVARKVVELNNEMEKLNKSCALYKEILENEGGKPPDFPLLATRTPVWSASIDAIATDDSKRHFATLSIKEALEIILKESNPLPVSQLIDELKRRGKVMAGRNTYNTVYATLSRGQAFKKQGNLWTLADS